MFEDDRDVTDTGEGESLDFLDDVEDPSEPYEEPMDEGTTIPEEIEVEDTGSAVAMPKGKNIAVIIALGIASIIFLYFYIFGEEEEDQALREERELIASQPTDQAIKPTPAFGEEPVEVKAIDRPNAPELQAPKISTLAPPKPIIDTPTPFQIDLSPLPPSSPDIATQRPSSPISKVLGPPRAEPPPGSQVAPGAPAHRTAPMVLINGGNTNPADLARGAPIANRDSGASMQTATQLGDTRYIIAQGKIIYAVLETAINTDLEGTLRGVISRDIYSESGRTVLIPKGSRLIGTYGQSIGRGQRRVLISWTRLIRPDGIDIQVNSPGVDPLGRSGTTGIVDNKYFDIFSNALLISAISVGGSLIADNLAGNSGASGAATSSTTVATDGNVTTSTTGDAVNTAISDAVTKFNTATKGIVGGFVDAQPTILIDQGTRINVFVNQDLFFPPELVDTVQFID